MFKHQFVEPQVEASQDPRRNVEKKVSAATNIFTKKKARQNSGIRKQIPEESKNSLPLKDRFVFMAD